MSNEALIGIIITVIVGIAGFFAYSSRKNVKVNQSSKGNGTQNMNNNTIGNDININKDKDDK